MSPLEPPFSTLPPEGPAPELDRSPGQKRTTARLWIAVTAGVCLVGLLTIILLPAFARINVDRGRPNTQNNMKVMGLVFKMYANESAGNHWPTLADNERIWAPDLSEIYPEFLQDPGVLVSVDHPDAEHIRKTLHAVLEGPNPEYDTTEGLMALSFAYLGYATNTEAGLHTLLEARKAGSVDVSGKNKSVPAGIEMIYPLREGIERFLITDINGPADSSRFKSSIPVLIETWQWKTKLPDYEFNGCNVLYFDGHVAWVPLGTFPVIPAVMNGLCGITP